ncbi:MAG TPA: hypothetical protein DIW52_10805 [Pseudomonas sp.]|nr:hypothetical protein [Pseudomonas sp.]
MDFFRHFFVVYEAAFASRPAPTFEMHSPVGASLLAKGPSVTPQISRQSGSAALHSSRNKSARPVPNR